MAMVLVACVGVGAEAQRSRTVAPSLPDFSRILVIAAHPDDELLVAPLLGSRCVQSQSKCSLLLMTHGESGACALPTGCGASLGATRAAEAAQSTALLNTNLELWSLADVMSDVETQWESASGGKVALLDRLRSAIADFGPTMILTFDPAHGSTCHPAHRAVGALVSGLDSAKVYLIETAVRFDGPSIQLSRGLLFGRSIVLLDMTRNWHFMTEAARLHASQFSPEQVASLDDPNQFRSIVLLRLADAAGARYATTCP